MAQSSARDINQKISLTGDDEVKRKLQSLGDAGEKALQQIEGAAGTSTAGLAAIGQTTAFSRLSASIAPATNGVRDFADHLGRVKTIGNEVGATLLGAFNVRDLGIVAATAAIVDFVRETARSLTALRNLALTSGFSKQSIVGLQQAFQEANVDVDASNFMLNKFAENTGEARAKALQFNTALMSGVTVLNGVRKAADAAAGAVSVLRGNMAQAPAFAGGVSVLRGGVAQTPLDLTDPEARFRALTGRSRTSFPATEQGQEQALEAFVQGLIKLNKVDASLANAFGTAEWGKRFKEVFPALEKAFSEGGFAKFKEEAVAKGLVPSADDIRAVNDYNKAVNDLGDAWEATKRKVGLSIIPTLTEELPKAAEAIQNMSGTGSAFTEMLKAAALAVNRGDWAGFGRGLTVAETAIEGLISKIPTDPNAKGPDFLGLGASFDAQLQKAKDGWAEWKQLATDSLNWFRDTLGGVDWSGIWSGFTSAAASAAQAIANSLNSLWNVIKDVGSAIATLFPGGSSVVSPTVDLASRPDFQIPDFSGALNFASGGLIRGPGGPRDDRIPIMASAGEFIVNAFAAARNLPLLQAINGLDRPLIPKGQRFALGGLVAASAADIGGAPVVFMLDTGGSFRLSGDRSVVDAMKKEARRSKILRTGVMPRFMG